MNTLELAHSIVTVLEEIKAENIVLLDIHGIADFADYFVICSGTSARMLDALSETTATKIKQEHKVSVRSEGQPSDGWLVLDFGDIVVHLFSPDQRDYYKLEELWNKGKILLKIQ
ncbi:MAG: ribosome silencing factor [Anaerolineaceae bacterium]